MVPPADEMSTTGTSRRGVRSIAALVGISVLSGAVGWVSSRQLQSPADVAARTKPPNASRIVAPVEFRVLRSTLFTRGTVRFGSPRVVTLPASAIKVGSLVVTKPPTKDDVLTEGSKAGDIGGRPVLVLEGEKPMYRDIRPGDRGEDVTALKASLRRLGYESSGGDAFDRSAERAVSEWMRASGYEPFGPTDAQSDRLKQAADAVREAREQVATAQLAVSKGQVVVTPDKILAADEAIQAALDSAQRARNERDKATSASELAIAQKTAAVATANTAIAAAELALQRAQNDLSGILSVIEAEQALKAAQETVIDADAAVVRANKAVDMARADAQTLAQEVPNAEAALADAKGAVTVATAELERQRAKPAPTILIAASTIQVDQESKDNAVRAAEVAVVAAQAGVRSAESALRAALRAVEKATAAIDDAISAVEPLVRAAQTARDQVRIAELRRTQAQQQGSNRAAGSTGADGSNGSVVEAQRQLERAKTAAVLAQRELKELVDALHPDQATAAAAVRAADSQVVIARAQRAQLSRPQDLSLLRATLSAAQSAQRSTEIELARLESITGVVVPANEVLFFPRLPLRVDDTKLLAGDAMSGAFMTVASQRLTVDASVDPVDVTGLNVGQKAEIEVTDLNIKVAATIQRVASRTGTDGVDPSRIYVELVPDSEALSTVSDQNLGDKDPEASTSVEQTRLPDLSELNGISVKVTIPITTTNGKVLVVPTAAVSAAVDGTTRVEVEESQEAPTRFVTVTAGLRSEGFVQVTPAKTGDLKEGELVVTGNRNGELLEGAPQANDRTKSSPPAEAKERFPKSSSSSSDGLVPTTVSEG